MKNRFVFAFVATLLCSTLCMAQVQKLPAPAKSLGKNVMEALWSRSSSTEFSDKMLSDQDLSNLRREDYVPHGAQLPGNTRVRLYGQGRL